MLCSIEHIVLNGSAKKTGQSVFHECSALLNCDFESGTMFQLFLLILHKCIIYVVSV